MTLTVEVLLLIGVEVLAAIALIMWREQACQKRIDEVEQKFQDDLARERSHSRSVSQALLNLLHYLELSGRHDRNELDKIKTMVINAGRDFVAGGDVVGQDKDTGSIRTP